MILDYFTIQNYKPINLSIGSIRKPTLEDISYLTFDKYNLYVFLLKITPYTYYTVWRKEDGGEETWNDMPEEKRNAVNVFTILREDKELMTLYLEMLNWFFLEKVIFLDEYFILLKDKNCDIPDDEIKMDDIRGVISEQTFDEIIEIIQQICYVYDKEEKEDEIPKFKNKLAEKMYEKMKKQKAMQKKKADENLTIPNIISAVNGKHPSLDYTNIYQLTVFQLIDTFNRMIVDGMYEIDSTRVSVWGDEKKNFDATLWYRNEYEKRDKSA